MKKYLILTLVLLLSTSVWGANKMAVVGGNDITLNLTNDKPLGAVVLAAKFAEPGSDVTLTSVSFEGTRVAHLEMKEAIIDNEKKTVLIYALPLSEDYLQAGEGPIAKLTFTGKDKINLEETTVSRQTGLVLVDKDANEIKAEFSSTPVSSSRTLPLPLSYELSQNFPNPFNAETQIKFALRDDGKVTLTVYNILGQKVRTLLDGMQTAGFKSVIWDGKNEGGETVASGVYFYRIAATNFTETKRMVLLK